MKNTINISLTLFTVFLILFQGCNSFTSTSFSKNEISKVEKFITKKLTITSRLNTDLLLQGDKNKKKKEKEKKKKKKKKRNAKKKFRRNLKQASMRNIGSGLKVVPDN